MADVHNSVPVTTIIGIASFFVTLITLTIIFMWKKHIRSTLRVNFITRGGKIERVSIKKNKVQNTIDYDKGKYVFDEKAVITSNWRHEIFYFKGVVTPLKFNYGKTKVTNISSENLKAIIETELIAKLFKKEVITFDNILIMLVLVLVAINLFFAFRMSSGGVNLADSPENIEIMKNIIKQALSSGV